MPVHLRPPSGSADLKRMVQLARSIPDGHLHVVDLPYRLSSWALDYAENIGLWEDTSGRLLAWAALQTPFWALDYALHPDAGSVMLAEILGWAKVQARTTRELPNGRPLWFVHVREDQTGQRRELEHAGFRSIEHDPDDPWSGLYLLRPDNAPALRSMELPDGFTIRPLRGHGEVAAYVALHRTVFGTANMTVEWRARTLAQPQYVPELDLVVEAPDGRVVAFCICWLGAHGPDNALTGQVEPFGVHPDFRELGLGRALLFDAVSRVREHGAGNIIVETDDDRDAAVALYRSAGFQVAYKIVIYRYDVEDTA